MHRKHKKPSTATSEVALSIVVTPMLDMTFQLLFFFVLTYKPSEVLEGQLDFHLPASGEARAKMPENVNLDAPSDTELNLPAQLTILIRTVRDGVNDGNISSLVVKSAGGETTVADLPALLRHLEAAHKEGGKGDSIKIEAESKLKYACVIDVMDICYKAHFEQVGFAAPPDMTSEN